MPEPKIIIGIHLHSMEHMEKDDAKLDRLRNHDPIQCAMDYL